ncbi:unnamed protein product [Tilletia laevis]|uniref:Uncharacterized protein n=3 Tax=Tilletia TaxID=13289 RepID=A0A8X7MRU2_9BASI|nr:hypothetical protein CF336_g3608 [Tilletia laevis]KAE8199244.1 hypothetical protein CF328_g3302 [Tilletia controversa]KAE8261834.1 hypothetical protein A4X03_0g2927 [Tilletia caries]KAE8203942.1 hypothetical protein CF335_g2836 [Tilletia laevis]KAE8245905.1 hypothetical protein A4X06_0g5336 [Tilletia controversa]
MTSNYDPVAATMSDPPTSIRDQAPQTNSNSNSNAEQSFISSSSNANTSARTDELTSSTSAERKGEVVVLDGAGAEAEGGLTQEVVKEGKEDVGLGEGGNVQID